MIWNRARDKKIFFMTMMVFLSTSFFAVPAWAKSADDLVEDSIDVIREMRKQDDVGSMADLIEGAHAIAFVPSMIKAGFVIGGEYGEGLILRKERGKWFGPSFYNLGGGSLGLQIGVQKTAFILVVNNQNGVDAFLRSRTKLGADVAVAAGPAGRRGDAATDARLKASIYSYSMTKGLFAGASLDGSILSISVKRNKEYWKKNISAADALKLPARDRRILPLIREIERISQKSGGSLTASAFRLYPTPGEGGTSCPK
ncbi:MAG: lipid-binding SYLF domain-containing protein [Synergistaceae bacterium]|jgi:lipid-binding SYLF domain-containing protein|nr:lipid-binding SYLF domain-containing protein [Synergistaceae bacterium]